MIPSLPLQPAISIPSYFRLDPPELRERQLLRGPPEKGRLASRDRVWLR